MATDGQESTGGILSNAILNFIGHGWLLLVGIVSTPILVRRLGTDAYGVLAIASVLIGYLTVLELGIGRAAVKFVAESLAAGAQAAASRLVATAAAAQIALGLVGAGVLWVGSSWLVGPILQISPRYLIEARAVFLTMALGFPLLLTGTAFEGTLMALQRFDLINLVRIVAGTLKAGLAIALVLTGHGLLGIVWATVAVQGAQLIAMAALVARLMPSLVMHLRPDMNDLRTLMRFGGWVTVSSVVGPILVYLDRFFVGMFLSTEAVAHYSIPFDAVTKLWIIPFALVPALFPAFAGDHGSKGRGVRTVTLSVSAVRSTFLTMAPVVVLIVIYADELLKIWIGEAIARHSAAALRILALGVLANSLAQIAYGMIQARGRPDLTAKFHLAETPLYVALCLWLIPTWGVTGAAAAWTLRVLIDGALLAVSAGHITDTSVSLLLHRALAKGFPLVGAFAIGAAAAHMWSAHAAAEALALALLVGVYVTAAWRFVIPPEERRGLAALIVRRQLAGRVVSS